MNIPARYCTGYLGDIGVPRDPAPMDFSAWFEVYLDGRWYTFDARHNRPRIGRIVMARGRDAADVAISTTFGVAQLVLSQIPDFHNMAWLSIFAAVMSFSYSFIGFGLGAAKVIGT
jgi:transglutaminase-like putative cysteine protease